MSDAMTAEQVRLIASEVVRDRLAEHEWIGRNEMEAYVDTSVQQAMDMRFRPVMDARFAGWEGRFAQYDAALDAMRKETQRSIGEQLTAFEDQMQTKITHAINRLEAGAQATVNQFNRDGADLIRHTQESSANVLKIAGELASARDEMIEHQREELTHLTRRQHDIDTYMRDMDQRYVDMWREFAGDDKHPGIRGTVEIIERTVKEHDWWHSKVKWLFTTKPGQRIAIAGGVGILFLSNLVTPENVAWFVNLIGDLF